MKFMKTPIIRIRKFWGNELSPKAYYFRIVAENGEIIAQSEAYTTARARNKTVSLLLAAKMEEETP